MPPCATHPHPKTARREEKSDKKKEERIGARLVAEIMGPPTDTAEQRLQFQILYGDLQAYIYNRRGRRSRATAVVTMVAITRAPPQSIFRPSCN